MNEEKFIEWLNTRLDERMFAGAKIGDRISWLVKVNGGWNVSGWE